MKKLNPCLFLGMMLFFITASASGENISDKQYLQSMVRKDPYKKSYENMLKLPDWVSEARGLASPAYEVSYVGKSFTVTHMCKKYDCEDNKIIVIFNSDGTKSWGLLATRTGDGQEVSKQFLGHPDSSIQKLLNKLLSDI